MPNSTHPAISARQVPARPVAKAQEPLAEAALHVGPLPLRGVPKIVSPPHPEAAGKVLAQLVGQSLLLLRRLGNRRVQDLEGIGGLGRRGRFLIQFLEQVQGPLGKAGHRSPCTAFPNTTANWVFQCIILSSALGPSLLFLPLPWEGQGP